MHKTSAALLLTALFLASSLTTINFAESTATPPTENTWTQKAPMPTARGCLGVVALEGKIYAIGGCGVNGVVGANEMYDPATDTWTAKASMPTPRAFISIIAFQNKIYCIGGQINNSNTNVNEVYDPQTDTWETKAPIPTAEAGFQAFLLNGKIYMVGGLNTKYRLANSTQVYDAINDVWSTEALFPTANAAALGIFDGKLFFVESTFDGTRYVSTTKIYDINSATYSTSEPPPTFFLEGLETQTAGTMATKRIYIFDTPYDLSSGGAPADTNQIFDPETGNWTAGADIPTPREQPGVAVVNDLIYVIGGFSINNDLFYGPQTTYYSTNEQYTPFGYCNILASSNSSGSFPITPVAIACGVAIALVCAGIAVFYSRKRKIKD
jgi:hypothetical protein